MTSAAKTPSQRGRSNRNKGLQAERDVCKWLRSNGFPHAERAVRTGFRVGDRVSSDPGDVTGSPGIVWSVKDCAVEQISKWMTELQGMEEDTTAFRLLVHKRRGHADPGEWWCWLGLADLALLALVPNTPVQNIQPDPPVRTELRYVVPLLRRSGLGSPIEVAS